MSTSSDLPSPCQLCQGCGRKQLPRSGRLRRFGSACESLLRRASSKLAKNLRHRHSAIGDLPVQSPGWGSGGCLGTSGNPAELDGVERYELATPDNVVELGGAEEAHGLLAGVQYLDVMSEQARIRDYDQDTCNAETSSLFDSSGLPDLDEFLSTPRHIYHGDLLDFSDSNTFRYLDQAISSTQRTSNLGFETTLRRSGAIYGGPRRTTLSPAAAEALEWLYQSREAAPSTCETPADPVGLNSDELEIQVSQEISPPAQTKPHVKSRKRTRGTRRRNSPENSETTPKISEPPEPRRTPRNAQWITLWKVRHDLRELYSKLIAATQDSSLPRANKVRRLFRDATHMLQVGLSTFLEVLKGSVPATLQKILAFVCVSAVMWNAVNRQKSDLSDGSKRSPLSGIHIWRSAILDTKDRVVLDRVVDLLWHSDSSAPEWTKGDDGTDNTHYNPDPGIGSSKRTKRDGGTDDSRHGSDAGNFATMDWTPAENDDLTGMDISLFGMLDMTQSGDNVELTQASLFDGYGHQLESAEGFQPEFLLQNFQSEVSQLLTETSSQDDIRFADFLNIPGLEDILPPFSGHAGLPEFRIPGPCTDPAMQDLVFDQGAPGPINAIPRSIDDAGAWWAVGDPVIDPTWLGTSGRPEVQSWGDTIGSSQSGKSPDTTCKFSASDGDVSFGPVLVGCLVSTVLFQTVMTFLRYLGGIGSVLHILSGCTKVKPEPPDDSQLETDDCSPNSCSPEYPLVAVGDFVAELSQQVVEPLRMTFRDGPSQLLGLLAMAETLAKCGTIRTLRAFEEYLVHTGLYLSTGLRPYMSLVKAILAQCLQCSSTMTWDHVYGDGIAESEEYSAEYISTREAQLRDSATSIFVPSSTVETEFSDRPVEETGMREHPSPRAAATTSATVAPRKIARCPHEGCSREYKGVDARVNLRRHIRCAHESSGGKSFSCPGAGCDLQTSRRNNLRNHFMKKHGGQEMPAWLIDKKRSRATKPSLWGTGSTGW